MWATTIVNFQGRKTLHNSLHSRKTVGQASAERCYCSCTSTYTIINFPFILYWWKKQDTSNELHRRLYTPHLLKLSRTASHSPGSSLMIFTAASSPVEMLRACRIQTQGGRVIQKGESENSFRSKHWNVSVKGRAMSLMETVSSFPNGSRATAIKTYKHTQKRVL